MMATGSRLSYTELLSEIKKLTQEEQKRLIAEVQVLTTPQSENLPAAEDENVDPEEIIRIRAAADERELTPDEKIKLYHASIHRDVKVNENFSMRREDWYGDDGR